MAFTIDAHPYSCGVRIEIFINWERFRVVKALSRYPTRAFHKGNAEFVSPVSQASIRRSKESNCLRSVSWSCHFLNEHYHMPARSAGGDLDQSQIVPSGKADSRSGGKFASFLVTTKASMAAIAVHAFGARRLIGKCYSVVVAEPFVRMVEMNGLC